MLSKSCKFKNGSISIKLKDNKFEFKPNNEEGQIAVLIDLSKDEFNSQILKLTVKRDDASPKIMLTLFKSDVEILKLSLETKSFSTEFLGKPEKQQNYSKIVQMDGVYALNSKSGLIEAVLTHNDDSVMSVLCDPRNNVNDTYEWLCTFWSRTYPSGEFCVSIDNTIVFKDKMFKDFSDSGIINLYVDEKCCLAPITEDDNPVALPWNQDGHVMVLQLSRILGFKCDEIRLFDGARTLLNFDTELDMEDFRSAGTSLSLEMFYEVVGATIRCEDLFDEKQFWDVMVDKKRTMQIIKERLAFRLEIDWMRLIICVEVTEEKDKTKTEKFKYCVGLPPPDISKRKPVGIGTFGKIYKYKDTSRKSFALKEFTAPFDGKTKCNIMKEVLVMSCVAEHDNIVKFFGVFEDVVNVYIVMEYVAGGSLRSYLTGPLMEEEIWLFSRDILRGLNHLHRLKIMHRDIKGDNVMLTADHQTAKLCDFGLSKILTDFSRSGEHTGECGTYRWMAPEVIRGEVYSFRADIWSFGATVVEMITGRVPCADFVDDDAALLHIGEDKTIPFESTHLSKKLKELVGACLRATSAERPPCDTLLSLPFFQEKTVLPEVEL